MLVAIKAGNLAVAFLLELCLLAALGYWGFHTGSGPLGKTALGIGVPLLVAVVWGLFLAPKAAIAVPVQARVVLKIALFGLAIVALAIAGRPTLAWAFAVIAVLNGALLYAWRQ